jgi:protein TonB
MLAYAANRPQAAVRRSNPKALLFIVGAHVVIVAAVISAKMNLPQSVAPAPIAVDLIRDRPPPPAHVPKPPPPREAEQSNPVRSEPRISTPIRISTLDAIPTLPKIGDLLGPVTQPLPQVEPQSVPMAAAPTLALLLTPPSELKPPYPQSKLLTGEEATLKLALSIDEHGRVVAVEPVGPADKVFLDAARRYLIAHWRYRPATLDGRPVASNLTITLRFELD